MTFNSLLRKPQTLFLKYISALRLTKPYEGNCTEIAKFSKQPKCNKEINALALNTTLM